MTSTEGAAPTRAPWGEKPFSLLGTVALYLEGWRMIVMLGLLGGLTAIAIVTLLPRKYSARAMFMAESGSESEMGALAGIAGQFGIPLGSGNSGPSPEFYQALATSSVILMPIAAESTVVSRESGASAVPLVDLLRARGGTPTRRVERATEKLQKAVTANYNRRTGVISLNVRTRWPQVSDHVASRILEQLNEFNLHTRQSRARAERTFAEQRVAEARGRLRAAEEELRRFMESNRSVRESPMLSLEVERRERELSLAQQVLGSLEPSLEDARLREVKDTPVITVLQAPTVLSVADPRGRIKFGLFGGIVGLLLAAVIIPVRHALREAGSEADPEARRFFRALEDLRRTLRLRSRRSE